MNSFIEEKAANFRKYLREQSKATNTQSILDSYSNEQLVPLVLKHLLPLYVSGLLGTAVDHIADTFANHDEAFKAKVQRYLECFCESLS